MNFKDIEEVYKKNFIIGNTMRSNYEFSKRKTYSIVLVVSRNALFVTFHCNSTCFANTMYSYTNTCEQLQFDMHYNIFFIDSHF